ncbi:MAG: BACON domain-containing protein [Deltaproteobacteria bacterium]|nr:BACON domain-containing protein [Deltaproteobacteria bacterium]MBN2671203.1 BACON domain-containing protein [Deltaproteobacteria bacterium]
MIDKPFLRRKLSGRVFVTLILVSVFCTLCTLSCGTDEGVPVALELSEEEVQLDDSTASYQVQLTNTGTQDVDVSWDVYDLTLVGEGTFGAYGLVSVEMSGSSLIASGDSRTVLFTIDRSVLNKTGTIQVPIYFYETGTSKSSDRLATFTLGFINSVALNVPSKLSFGGSLDMVEVEEQIMIVEALGTNDFDWSITSEEAWVQVSPDSGSGTTEVTVTVDRVIMQSFDTSICSGGTYSSDDPNCVRRTCFSTPLHFTSNLGDVDISVSAELHLPCE